MKLIYGYFFKENNQCKYVGQTSNLKQRRQQHESNEAFNEKRREYKYPLSRAFRKYGVEAFECRVLEENIPESLADEREIFWIATYNTYQNGYNQTPGGNAKIIIPQEDIQLIYRMLRSDCTYKQINEVTHLCYAEISMINNGLAYTQPGETYPIKAKAYGKRLPDEVVKEIQQLLINKEIKVRDIGEIYNVGFNVVVRINSGESYHDNNLNYPLRVGRVREKKSVNYQELLETVRKEVNAIE